MDLNDSVKKAKEILEATSEESKEQAMDFINEASKNLNSNLSSDEFKEETIKKVDAFFDKFNEQISAVADEDKIKEIKNSLVETIINSKENGFDVDIMQSLTSLISIISSEL